MGFLEGKNDVKSCYHENQRVQPQYGHIQDEGAIVTEKSKPGNPKVWNVVKIGEAKDGEAFLVTLEAVGAPPYHFLCYDYRQKKAILKPTSRDVWLITPTSSNDPKYTIELSDPRDDVKYLTFNGDDSFVTVEKKENDDKALDKQYWKFIP